MFEQPQNPSPFLKGKSPETPRRGVTPTVLLFQIRNTAPFLFAPGWEPAADEPHLKLIRNMAETLERQPFRETLFDHYDYFELCLSAHHATVATFVPTDVDNQIRFKLWHPSTPVETVVAMAELVLRSRQWSNRSVSARSVTSPESGESTSGHDGEWLSTAVAAYGALRRRAPERAKVVLKAIIDEILREEAIFADFKKRKDGLNLLRTATVIAHNLGDLNRVIEMWTLPPEDALYEAAFQIGEKESRNARPLLVQAGELNRAFMAVENHRYFALRVPRAIRRSAELLSPIGPFFDEWGAKIARHPELRPEEVGTVAEALTDGWERLQAAAEAGPAPVGYARALAGIEEGFPGGLGELSLHVPARIAKKIKTGPLRSHASIPRHRFEGHWNQAALKLLHL